MGGPCAPPMVVAEVALAELPLTQHMVGAEGMVDPAAVEEEEIKVEMEETEGPTVVAAVAATGPAKAETAETAEPTAAEEAAEMAAELSPSAAAAVHMAEMEAAGGQ